MNCFDSNCYKCSLKINDNTLLNEDINKNNIELLIFNILYYDNMLMI